VVSAAGGPTSAGQAGKGWGRRVGGVNGAVATSLPAGRMGARAAGQRA